MTHRGGWFLILACGLIGAPLFALAIRVFVDQKPARGFLWGRADEEDTGIAECDEYLRRMSECANGMLKSSLMADRESIRRALATPGTRELERQRCANSLMLLNERGSPMDLICNPGQAAGRLDRVRDPRIASDRQREWCADNAVRRVRSSAEWQAWSKFANLGTGRETSADGFPIESISKDEAKAIGAFMNVSSACDRGGDRVQQWGIAEGADCIVLTGCEARAVAYRVAYPTALATYEGIVTGAPLR